MQSYYKNCKYAKKNQRFLKQLYWVFKFLFGKQLHFSSNYRIVEHFFNSKFVYVRKKCTFAA